jgi:DNA invertase Pin-like site-specific DNA recombinase
VAERSGWDVVRIYEDAGISGAKGRDKRPGLDSMMRAVNAKRFDMVAAWSVDRLGRSLTDLLGILQGPQDKGVDLFLHQQGLDTSTTAGKAMFQMPANPRKRSDLWPTCLLGVDYVVNVGCGRWVVSDLVENGPFICQP